MEDATVDQFEIDGIRTELRRFLRRFESCGQDTSTRNYFRIYMNGLISKLPRKNCEAIALQAGVPVRSVQWFLAGQGCRAAGIPDEIVYRPKWEIALEQYDRAIGNGITFEFVTFDEGYGGKPEFLRQLDARDQLFIGEVSCVFYAWTHLPRTTMKSGKHGRKRIKPRLVKGQHASIEVQNMLKYSPVLRDQSWTKYCVKESDKGPVIWEIKECEIFIRSERLGVPMEKPLRLIVARNVMNEKEEEIKYFVSNAPKELPLDNLLLAAFSRWRVERSFQDTKQKLGLDHYEGRCYTGLIRHLLLCSLAYCFLQRQWLELSKKTAI